MATPLLQRQRVRDVLIILPIGIAALLGLTGFVLIGFGVFVVAIGIVTFVGGAGLLRRVLEWAEL